MIDSLLLLSEMEREAFAILLTRFEELIQQRKYQHSVPALESRKLKSGRLKCMLDFTDCLDNSLEYCAALDQFLIRYEQLLCDVILLEKDRRFRLSAVVHVDPNLAIFELKIPRIPSELHRFQSFSFDYWVWHSHDAAPESEAWRQGVS